MKYIVLLCLGVCLALMAACSKSRNDKVLADTHSQASPLTQSVNTTMSSLDMKRQSTFRVAMSRLKGVDTLRAVSFPDEIHGWVGGAGKLFRTTDGGTNWSRLAIDMPKGSDVEEILFVSPTMGWIVLQTPISNVLAYHSAGFWVMHTSDGGQSWQLQHSDKEAVVTQVSFGEQGNGWLTGIRYLGPARYTHLILQTSDSGQHWTEVSENLKRSDNLCKETPREIDQKVTAPHETNDGIMRVIPIGSCGAKVITGRKAVFVTFDCGMSWRPVAVVRDEFDQQAGIHSFGENKNKSLWIAAGADSVEGTRGVLTIQQADDSWSRYELNGVYFADAISLSTEQFMACGYVRASEGRKSRREGVILYSADAAQSWSAIYQGSDVNAVNALTFVGPNQVLAVGERGLFLRAERVSP